MRFKWLHLYTCLTFYHSKYEPYHSRAHKLKKHRYSEWENFVLDSCKIHIQPCFEFTAAAHLCCCLRSPAEWRWGRQPLCRGERRHSNGEMEEGTQHPLACHHCSCFSRRTLTGTPGHTDAQVPLRNEASMPHFCSRREGLRYPSRIKCPRMWSDFSVSIFDVLFYILRVAWGGVNAGPAPTGWGY